MIKSKHARRMQNHHKRNRGSSALNLVSLMDIFTILVFFLLVNSSDVQVLPNAKDVEMPESVAQEKPRETVVILVTDDDILIQGAAVASVADVMAQKGLVIETLKAALVSQTNRMLDREVAADIAGREVTIMGDKEIPYRLLKRSW
ncbi:MAG: biopolymer transporter ExbD, partial [Chromatiales bacterium]|nr:biopolymer transporter ExbD [Chromatiales bacterium]